MSSIQTNVQQLVMHMTDPTFIEESRSFKVVQIGKGHKHLSHKKKVTKSKNLVQYKVDQTTIYIYILDTCVCVTFTHLLHQIKSFLNVKHVLF